MNVDCLENSDHTQCQADQTQCQADHTQYQADHTQCQAVQKHTCIWMMYM